MMSHAKKKQKIDRELSNAAYNTSLPLFNALREAGFSFSDQRILLETARDKLTISNNDGDAYLSSIVAAWQGATQTFHEIFHQITLITAANKAQGRPAAESHEKYVAILDTISKSRHALAALHDFKKESDENAGEQTGEVGDKESEAAQKEPRSAQSFKPATSLTIGLKRPFVEDDPVEEDTKSSHNHYTKANKPSARIRRARNAAFDAAPPATPVVEFEDVNSEVEERLKAKLQKVAERKARRVEKKRKRESLDSLVDDEKDEQDEDNDGAVKTKPMLKIETQQPAVEITQAEKPRKKKIKKMHIQVDDVSGNVTAKARAAPSTSENISIPRKKSILEAVKRKSEIEPGAVEDGGVKKRKTKHVIKN